MGTGIGWYRVLVYSGDLGFTRVVRRLLDER